ncbi:MAG: NosD domain-containing protein [Candidatus Bathyarchaeia archaeon]|jgi:parallel beta-helix repeat protein
MRTNKYLICCLTTALVCVIFIAPSIKPVEGKTIMVDANIIIRADGSIEGTENIQHFGDTYVFTDNIYNSHGIAIEKSDIVIDGSGFTINGTETRNYPTPFDDYYAVTGLTLNELSNVSIRNLVITDFNVGIRGSLTNGCISGNNITGNGVGVQLESLSTTNLISNNSINGLGLIGSYNKVIGNNITNKEGDRVQPSLWLAHGENSYFAKNLISTSASINGSNTQFIHNSFGLVSSLSAYGNNLTISDNDFVELVASGKNLCILDNRLAFKGTISINQCSSCIVIGNNLTRSFDDNYASGNAIGDYGGQNNIISNNTITGKFDYGLYLTAQNDLISGNYIANNEGGIKMENATKNTITNNTITFTPYVQGHYAIKLSNSGDNLLYKNILLPRDSDIKNPPGCYVSAGNESNLWDNGQVGNNWSDYMVLYPNATEVENSGIGNAPYVINGANIDHYPIYKSAIISVSPSPSSSREPQTTITTANPSDITNHSVEPSPTIPEFPSTIFLTLIIISIIAGALIYRKRIGKLQ